MENNASNVVLVVGGMRKGHGVSEYIYRTYSDLSGKTKMRFVSVSETGAHEFDSELKTHGINSETISPFWKNPFKYIFQWFALLLRYRHAFAIHFHADKLYFKWIPVFIAKCMGYRNIIIQSHNASFDSTEILKIAQGFGKFVVNKLGTRFIAVSSKAGEFMFSSRVRNGGKFSVILNGIDTTRFSFNVTIREKIRAQNGWSDSFILGNVGRLSNQKNQSFLIRLVSILRLSIPNVRLVIIGDGPDLEMQQTLARDLGVFDIIEWLHSIDNIQDYYSAFDLFLFPSLYEGLPLSVLEAQSCGLFCLISDQVSSEVSVGNLSEQLPLVSDKWGNEIVKLNRANNIGDIDARKRAAVTMSAMGFDVSNQVGKVLHMYSQLK